MRATSTPATPLVHAIVDQPSGQALGQAGYMNIDRGSGCIEVGGIVYAPALQRTRAATEACFS
jgi:RimJ/RimL family protein N-acetyltransferase